MKHPLNHCSMHTVHAFSHSGEPVWDIEILRCMQFRAFCESLRATCQPGDFSQMWSRQCLFCQLVPTVDVASCWCRDRTAWVSNLNLMRITVTKTPCFQVSMEAIMYSIKGDQHLLISNYHRFFNLQMSESNPCTPCTACFYHDFRGSKCNHAFWRWLGLPRLHSWRVSKQGTVRFIPKIGELQGYIVFNMSIDGGLVITHKNDDCISVYISHPSSFALVGRPQHINPASTWTKVSSETHLHWEDHPSWYSTVSVPAPAKRNLGQAWFGFRNLKVKLFKWEFWFLFGWVMGVYISHLNLCFFLGGAGWSCKQASL